MSLLVGVSEVDITPPIGTLLCGSLAPRKSTGIQDPLLAKAIVLQSGNARMAYVVMDLATLGRDVGDRAVALASERTGIPVDHIVWATTHSHTSPYPEDLFPTGGEDPVNRPWLASLPEKFADGVAAADRAKVPARMSRRRAYNQGVSQNRRYRFKDGREINSWLIHRGEEDIQCIGTAAPIDPEVGIVAFDDAEGKLHAVVFYFCLHTNANFGPCFSGDYPAVVSARIRERFGPQVVTLFLPGPCGDINHAGRGYRQVGDSLADVILPQLDSRRPSSEPPKIAAMKREIVVPFRDWTVPQEERIRASQWSTECQDYFRRNLEIMRQRGDTEAKTIIQAWHWGEVAFASFPGELFIEWGLQMKQESPFPWTYPVELGADYVGYLVTPQAWKAGGYESLISTVAPVSVAGVQAMKSTACDMLQALHRQWQASSYR